MRLRIIRLLKLILIIVYLFVIELIYPRCFEDLLRVRKFKIKQACEVSERKAKHDSHGVTRPRPAKTKKNERKRYREEDEISNPFCFAVKRLRVYNTLKIKLQQSTECKNQNSDIFLVIL